LAGRRPAGPGPTATSFLTAWAGPEKFCRATGTGCASSPRGCSVLS
jgi:hypothetical protein